MNIQSTLQRIQGILESHPGEDVVWIASVMAQYRKDESCFYQALNSRRMWGSAGSVANQALADNPGIDERIWHEEIREFRKLMIELGLHLQARGNENPDISSWLLAFSNWNQSEI